MSHLIDIILVAVVLLVVFISAKRGIILTVLDLASGIVAFIAARAVAPVLSPKIYDAFVKDIVVNFLTEKYNGIENTIAESVNNLASVFDFLPEGVLTYIESSGLIDGSAVSQNIMNSITTVAELETNIIAPVLTAVVQLLAFAVLALVFIVIFKVVSRFIAKIITVSKIADKLNSVLGAVFGILKGCIYAFIIAAVVTILSCTSPTVAEYAADSYICSFVASLIGI